MKYKIYTVELKGGRTGLLAANNITEAKRKAYGEDGRNNVTDVRLATEDEINWVRAMGGYVPDLKQINAK